MKQNKFTSNNNQSNSTKKLTNNIDTDKNIINYKKINIKNKVVKLKENKSKSSSKNRNTINKKNAGKIKNEPKKREKIIFDLKLTKREINKLINDSQKSIQTKKSSDNIFLKKLNFNEKNILKDLNNKQQNLYNSIEKINLQKNYLNEYSLNNINKKNIFYKNIQSDNIRNLDEDKKNLFQKLSTINQQIKDFNRNIKLNNNDSRDEYLEKIKQDKNFNEIKKKIKILQIQSNLSVKKRLEEAEVNQEKRKKEIELIEKEENEENEKELKEMINNEKKIVELRKQEMNMKMEKFKPFINNNFPKERNRNYLYIKMATSFEKNEEEYKNKILKNKSNEEKDNSKELDKKDFVNKRKRESMEGAKILQQIWKERTDLLPKYVSPMYEKVISSDNYIKENEKNKIENKKKLFDIRQKYGKEKVHLPLISNILKRKNEKKDIKYKIIQNKFQKQQNNNSMNIKVFQINKINNENTIKKTKNNNNNFEKKKIFKSFSCTTLNNNNNLKNRNNISNNVIEISNDENNKLDEIKKNKLLKNKLNEGINNNKKLNVEEIKGKIEVMEDKYRRGKELIKVKGGYMQNKELGDEINNILIDSIKNKLDIIENLYK